MIEKRSIVVDAFRDPQGVPTCCKDWNSAYCRFLQTRSLGLTEVCGATGRDINRDSDGVGYLRPVAQCPVWKEEKVQ